MAVSPVMPMFLLLLCMKGVLGLTDPQSAAALRALHAGWKGSNLDWKGNDPCGSEWEGVICTQSKVTSLSLSTMNLQGTLTGDIGYLTDLRSLDLSYNKGLTGPIPDAIGKLIHLDSLIMIGCSFSGSIPRELGNLRNLTFLALNSNKLSGEIPAEVGNLDQLYWFDIADNQLTGSLPVSTPTSSGLDKLFKTKHFHFSRNRLNGHIPSQIFNGDMQLIHLLFDSNDFSGDIPRTLGLVTTLEALRLDRNFLSGYIPPLSNLTKVSELHLSNNRLKGTVPDLSTMAKLSYLDASNNSFEASEAPEWMEKLISLTTLAMENSNLHGRVPEELFSLPQLQTANLKRNHFNGSLSMGSGTNIAPELEVVDLEFNQIESADLGTSYNKTLWLLGNPTCNAGSVLSNVRVCEPPATEMSYTTASKCSMDKCKGKAKGENLKTNPKSCECQVPYSGQLVFRAPSFSDLSNSSITMFKQLEDSLTKNLSLPQGFAYICCLKFDEYNYLVAQLQLFPPHGKYFSRKEIRRLGFSLSKQTYKPPHAFGPFYFIPDNFNFAGGNGERSFLSSNVVIGIAAGVAALAIGIVAVTFYAIRQKKRAEKALELSKPFMSWATGTSGGDSSGAPKLKGARWFSLQELRKSTNNFSEANEIGSGGYGKVYKGILPGGGEMVAIKRAKIGSIQGGAEFKTEIELLSRVHHRNLVGLLGFCFEQGEQVLIYEYMSNGSLRESLCGKTGIHLDWKRRMRIALGSARGLSYLHELANPPIIHRDVKSANILLDENLTAKVADFGLSKLILEAEGGRGHITSQVKGTMGYLDPEYYMTHQLSEKSDVYSFGVVLLEMLTGKQPLERGKYVVREVKTAVESRGIKGLMELVDPLLLPLSREPCMLPGVECYASVALMCVQEQASARPTMSQVVKDLEFIVANLDSDNLNLPNMSRNHTNLNYSSSPLGSASASGTSSSVFEGYFYSSQSQQHYHHQNPGFPFAYPPNLYANYHLGGQSNNSKEMENKGGVKEKSREERLDEEQDSGSVVPIPIPT